MGFALLDAISVPPDLTKPISRRPREMTSAVAYSSAIRTGSCRSETSVPMLRMRTLRVWRARMPRISGFAPKWELIPAWCSMATTFSPWSSHSMNSSRTSSNRSAAIRGSQYLFGRLARTESAPSRISRGTKGYGFSHWYQTSMACRASDQAGAVLSHEVRAHVGDVGARQALGDRARHGAVADQVAVDRAHR